MLAHPFFPPRLLRLALLAGLLPLAVSAASTPLAPLTLPETFARVAERNPTLLAHAFVERSAAALIEQAALPPNPTLELEAENLAGTGALRGTRGLEATVLASQPIERGGKRDKRVALARRDRDTAAHDYAVRRAETLATAAQAFVATLVAQHRVARTAEPLQLARDIAAAAERRAQAGDASATESARARALAASAQADLARAEADLTAARARLAATWGGHAAEVPAVAGTLLLPDTLPAETALSAKLAAHPRLAFQQAVVAARRASLDLERAHATPDLTVAGGVRFLRANSDAALVAGLSVPLPTRHRNQGNIRAARETLAGAEHSVRAVEFELRAAFAAAWQEVTAAHAAAQTLRRTVLPATDEALAVVRRAYAAGHLPLLDVLDAQRAVVAVRRELADHEAAWLLAFARAEALADPAFPATTALLSLR